MKRAVTLEGYPAGRPLTADQITEFHAARLVLLLHACGSNNRIEGLTKLAKLDFFVRYPSFFERVAKHLSPEAVTVPHQEIESSMVRHHYGPWDPRYYAVLAFLEGREVIEVSRNGKAYVFSLTPTGVNLAKRFEKDAPFRSLVSHMHAVKKLLGNKNGEALKKLVYEVFDDEVAQLQLGDVIRP